VNNVLFGEFGENFVSVENLYNDKQILEYKINDELVALFKSVKNNERLKALDSSKTDVLRAWSERELYEDLV
jgi:ribosomal protein S1